mmetsp:Transcript_20738/g.30693  ORF Transcript_20738/g.30693 Transcript_20738/m.30693 type:complete len:445 (+) Transcript_20738:60-1394(+)
MKVDKTKIDDENNCLKEGETVTISKILDLANIVASNNYNHILKMDLPNCGLSELPVEFGATFTNLEILFLSNNRFREMPPITCPQLKMVAFRSNGMTSIHPDALLAPKLQWLILTNNALTELPDTIGRCANLEKLMLTGNQITHLPSSITQCRKLVMIRLASNALKQIPLSVLTLPNMKWLAFSDNPCTCNIKIPNPNLPVLEEIQENDGEILGEGGGGVTRKVWYGNKYVAVKTYHGTMTTDGLPEEERRMATIAGRLSSPCLIQVLGQTKGGALVMEFLEGYEMMGGRPNFDTCWKDVYDDDSRSKWTGPQALEFVTGLLKALAQLHAIGLCHGDFYGHNILIQPNNPTQVRLGDFGGAFFYDTTDASTAPFIRQCELRSFAVLVEEVINHCLFVIEEGDDDTATATTSSLLRSLMDQSLKADTSFDNVLDWWSTKNSSNSQ